MKGKYFEPLIDAMRIRKTALIFRAVNHPLRQSILQLLHKNGRLNVTQIYKAIQEEQSLTSMHLAVLRKADLVHAERQGRVIVYTLNYKRLKQANAAMADLGV